MKSIIGLFESNKEKANDKKKLILKKWKLNWFDSAMTVLMMVAVGVNGMVWS